MTRRDRAPTDPAPAARHRCVGHRRRPARRPRRGRLHRPAAAPGTGPARTGRPPGRGRRAHGRSRRRGAPHARRGDGSAGRRPARARRRGASRTAPGQTRPGGDQRAGHPVDPPACGPHRPCRRPRRARRIAAGGAGPGRRARRAGARSSRRAARLDRGLLRQPPGGAAVTAAAPRPGSPDATIVAALQAALATEHAAVWAYGVVAAFAADRRDAAVAEATATHRSRRDATERLLSDAGVDPVPAEPGYRVPVPVTDPVSAVQLAVTVETDTAQVWRAVIERSSATGVRSAALEALTGAAVRATRWRAVLEDTPPTVPFPGRP
ncbi:MAG: DUF4439 domain-containing protein [Pseudonocardiaceae bacterium]|nr:DUF4439 domain-containing protein [Pseudonocardiaceae bacterium]